MRRRDFIAWLVAGTWPAMASAQQAKGVPVIGLLIPAEREPVWTLFREGLVRAGYVDGKSIHVEVRSAAGNPQLLREQARELVRLDVRVIVAHQTPAAFAAKQATDRIPIVMAGSADPVAMGLVESLARPGGNVTGLAGNLTEVAPKLFQLMKEVLPSMRRVLVLGNGADPYTKVFLPTMENAGRTLGVETRVATLQGAGDFAAAFADAIKLRADAVIVQPSLPRKPSIDLSIKHRLPTVSPARAYTDDGALMSYSSVFKGQFYGSAVLVDRILKGANPADLPVQQPTHYELVINLKAAKALGVTFPQSILLRADRVIE